MAKIVLNTTGSLGDLHPYIAIGRELAREGHEAVIATHRLHQDRVVASGLAFHAVRPDFDDPLAMREDMRAAMDERNGSRYVLERFVLPHLREMRDDLIDACRGANVLVDHVLSLAGPPVAESLKLPRVRTVLQPLAMFSSHDPPLMPGAPAWVRDLGPFVWTQLWKLARATTRHWVREVDEMRREMGLPRSTVHPMLQGSSDHLNLALFSRHFAAPMPDWPPRTIATGFPWYDGAAAALPGDLRDFLAAGPAPVVFTLGSSGIWDPGGFYEAAAGAVRDAGMRGVLLVGEAEGLQASWEHLGGDDVKVVPYAPHSLLFPAASVIVHHGGVGTTGQALRAGRPVLVVPYSHDQPDNAARCVRLGVGRTIHRSDATEDRIAETLRRMRDDVVMHARATRMRENLATEDGAGTAAVAIAAAAAKT